jgi:FkbM family methyltransferase
MHEIKRGLGLDFIVRTDSVDRENLDWMSDSPFIQAFRDARVACDDHVLDLGSHIGTFSLAAALEANCRVIGFEPDRESFNLARANALINKLDHLVTFHCAAIGGRDGVAFLYEASENWGHTLISTGGPYNKLTGNKTEVALLSLDKALTHIPGDKCRFVKFNIEGAEFDMLQQASKHALQKIDTLVGEVHHDIGAGLLEPCIAKLKDNGFDINVTPCGEVRSILLAKKIR